MSCPRKRSRSIRRSGQTGRHNHENHRHGRHLRPHSHEITTAVADSGQSTSLGISGQSTTSTLSDSRTQNQTTAPLPQLENEVGRETTLSPLENALNNSISTTPAASGTPSAPSTCPSTSTVSASQAVAGPSKPTQGPRYFPSVCHGSACQQNMGPQSRQQTINFRPSRCIRRGQTSNGRHIHQESSSTNTECSPPPPISALFGIPGMRAISPLTLSVVEVTGEDETAPSITFIFGQEQVPHSSLLNWEGFISRILLPSGAQGPLPLSPSPSRSRTRLPQPPQQEGANSHTQHPFCRRRRRQPPPPP